MIKIATKKWVIRFCLIAGALTILILYPVFAPSNYILAIGIKFLVFASLGSAWNIIGGYAEQISWCHASFVAIGAYTSFLMYNFLGITPWIGILVGVCISVVIAIIIGLVSFRLRGPFFSLSTIAFGEILRVWLLYRKDLTNGASGMVVTFRGDSFLSLTFSSYGPYYYILLALLVITVLVSWWTEQSKTGYYLKAIKADEDAAQSLGINTYNVKLKAFVISAMLTTVIGGVYAFFISYIDPASFSALDLSVRIGSMAILGGLGTLSGPLIGAAILIPTSEIANITLGSVGAGMLLYGLLLILVFIFRPKGVRSFFVRDEDAGTKNSWRRFFKEKRR